MKQTNEKSKVWCLIIEALDKEGKGLTEWRLVHSLKVVALNYYLILHDKDYNESGELKRPHYHCIIELEQVVGKGRLLTFLERVLKIDKNRITACTTINLTYDLRYLTHRDNSEKTLYLDSEVKTNNKALYEKLVSKGRYINEDSIEDIARNSNNKIDFIKKIGMN